MFGKRFQYTPPKVKASEGEHIVTISGVTTKTIKGLDVLDIFIRYENGEDLSPDFIRFFDVTPDSTPEQVRAFNYRMSLFCDCFNLPKSLAPEYWSEWVGRQGKIAVGKDKQGYLAVTEFIANFGTTPQY